MRLEPMSVADVGAIAALHRRSIDWSMTSRLGYEYVCSLYEALLAQPQFFGYVCREANEIVGFSTATFDYTTTRAVLGKLYGQRLPRILFMAITNPKNLANLIESRFLLPRLFARVDTLAEWLSLVTDERQPQLAPAATVALIRQIRETFREGGVKYFVGQSYARNRQQLRKLYGHFGGTVMCRLWINDFYVFQV
jgi:hypothetical protein